MTLRVLLDGTPLLGNPTGIGVFTNGLLHALLARDEVSVAVFGLTTRGIGQLPAVLPEGVPHNRLPMPAAVLMKLWAQGPHPSVERWMGRSNVVHGTNFVVPPTRTAGQLVTVHDLTAVRFPELCEPVTLQYPALIKAAVGRGAHVHVLSTFVADEVCELLDVPVERVHVIPPGLRSVDGAAPASPSTGRSVFAIGTLEPRKDYPTLIKAFDLVASMDDDVRLVIAGGSGWGSAAVRQQISQARFADRIQLLGRIDDETYASLLRNASVLAYPSIYEGFGFPPLEAMQIGTPVVATEAASLPEVCGDAALFVPPRDEASLAAALTTLLNDDQTRTTLIERGRKRVAELQWSATAQQFVNLYEEIKC